jgi:hypothetical protein
MMARRCCGVLWQARQRLRRCISSWNLHNSILQEDTTHLELVVQRGKYIVKGARICSRLHWIQEGDKGSGSKFFFDFLKKKVVVDKVLALCRPNGSLQEDPAEIKSMFGLPF